MIETWLPENGWPTPVLEAVRRFRQGHVFLWDSIAYGAKFSNAVCKPTIGVGTEGTGYTRIDSVWKHVIITTQTCDICEEGRKRPKMPWIAVAPVYDIMPLLVVPGQANQIRTHGFSYLIPLTHPNFVGDVKLWVADLRVEYPLEKSVLVGQDPIEAFASDGDYNDFADRLAWRRNRPAIDARVREFVTSPLGDALISGQIKHEPIVEMRLQCGPSWDQVERAKLFAIVRDGVSVDPIEDEFTEWQESLDKLPADLTLLPTAIVARAGLLHALAQETVTVDYSDVSELGSLAS